MSTSTFTLTPKRLFEGVWTAMLDGPSDAAPELSVTHLERAVAGVTLTATDTPNRWELRVPIPVEVICDGVQTFLVTEMGSGAQIGSFSLMSGEALGDDIRAELDLLRAELDMLKRAFRRHCVETL